MRFKPIALEPANPNLICTCGHSLREHAFALLARGHVSTMCLMAACPCMRFIWVADVTGEAQKLVSYFAPGVKRQRQH